MLKRLLDFAIALVLLLMLAPIMALVAIMIRTDSPGSVFFCQQRVGHLGKIFTILKFRSMVANAGALGGFRTETRDPRITRMGKILRRTSLDELPQLINVLRGEMSFVGPRPDVPAQESDYSPEVWQLRHSVRPGLTGLAQATLRSDATPDERKQLDLQYVRQASLRLDARIVLLTVRQVLMRGGN